MSYLRPHVRRGMGSLSSGPRGPRISSIALSDDAPSASSLPSGVSPVTGTVLDPGSYGPATAASSGTSPVKIAAIAAIALLAYKFIAG